MKSVRPYYSERGASTAFYDVVTEADKALTGDIDLYAGLVPAGGSVLELGTGTGRVAFELASRGFNVVGVDISPAMLAQAERKQAALAQDVAERVRFVRGDMTSLALAREFDAVFATFYTLAHMPPGAAWRNTFRGIVRHLKPEGVVAVHLPVGEKMAGAPPAPHLPVFRREVGEGRTLTLFVAEQTMREPVGRMDLTLEYVLTSATQEQRQKERLTLYRGEPSPFAAEVGLVPEGQPLDLGGVGLVYVFRKAKPD